jgi:hypothetical protein
MIFKLIKRWSRQDNAPPPPKGEDTSSMADLVRLLEREKETAK